LAFGHFTVIFTLALGHFPLYKYKKQNKKREKNAVSCPLNGKFFKFEKKKMENQLKLSKYMTGLNFETI